MLMLDCSLKEDCLAAIKLQVFIERKYMPKIESTTVLNQINRIAPKLVERGENWTAEHSAVVIVRSIMEELGLKEELTSDEYKQNRLDCIALVKPFITAAKNYQNSYLAQTNVMDGKPLMPAVKGSTGKLDGEFA